MAAGRFPDLGQGRRARASAQPDRQSDYDHTTDLMRSAAVGPDNASATRLRHLEQHGTGRVRTEARRQLRGRLVGWNPLPDHDGDDAA